MRILTFFLVVAQVCLWIATSTQSGCQSHQQNNICCDILVENDPIQKVEIMCSCESYITSTTCENSDGTWTCMATYESNTENTNGSTTTSMEVQQNTDDMPLTTKYPVSTTTEVISDNITLNTSSSNDCTPSNSLTAVVLGALDGLLVALLALVTTGWVWTYLVMRRRAGRLNICSEKDSSVDQLYLNNPTYSSDDVIPLQQPAPSYETIPPHPKDGGKIVLTQQGGSEYHVLSRNQNSSTAKSAIVLETIHEDDKEVSYSKLERMAVSNGQRDNSQRGDYSTLEETAVSKGSRDVGQGGGYSLLERMAVSIGARDVGQGGDYSLLERTAVSIGARDVGQGGDYSLLERTAVSIGARDVGQDSDYSLLVQTEKSNGARGVSQDGDYSKLETLTLASKTTGDGATSTTVSEEKGVKSDNQRKDGEVMDEASSGEGVLQSENENSEKGPNYEEPEMLPMVTGNMGNELANEENDDPSMTTNPCYKEFKMTPK